MINIVFLKNKITIGFLQKTYTNANIIKKN